MMAAGILWGYLVGAAVLDRSWRGARRVLATAADGRAQDLQWVTICKMNMIVHVTIAIRRFVIKVHVVSSDSDFSLFPFLFEFVC